jgi:hypothetical protein
MFQRIQSIYLLLVPVVVAFMFNVSLATIDIGIGTIGIALTGFTAPDGFLMPESMIWIAMPILGVLLGIVCIGVALMFRNRARQIKMNRISLMLNVLFVASIFYVTDQTVKEVSALQHAYNLGAYLSLIPAILIYLANGRIRKDEQKVRAADRIR